MLLEQAMKYAVEMPFVQLEVEFERFGMTGSGWLIERVRPVCSFHISPWRFFSSHNNFQIFHPSEGCFSADSFPIANREIEAES